MGDALPCLVQSTRVISHWSLVIGNLTKDKRLKANSSRALHEGVATAKEYLATVYLKHRSLQSRKARYRG